MATCIEFACKTVVRTYAIRIDYPTDSKVSTQTTVAVDGVPAQDPTCRVSRSFYIVHKTQTRPTLRTTYQGHVSPPQSRLSSRALLRSRRAALLLPGPAPCLLRQSHDSCSPDALVHTRCLHPNTCMCFALGGKTYVLKGISVAVRPRRPLCCRKLS